MGPTIKLGFAQKVALRYKKAKLDKKSQILDEFCATFDYNRKYAIRKLNTLLKRRPPKPKQKPGPQSKYNLPEILKPLKIIWLTANLPCSKRLKQILPLWLPSYQMLSTS